MRYLLDTNVVSNLVRRPQGPVAKRIRQTGEARVCTSIIVAAELRFRAEKKDSARLTEQVETVSESSTSFAWKPPRTRCTGRRERMGQQIGGNDLLIAAQTVALGYTLVTDNEREFTRIAELPVENWPR